MKPLETDSVLAAFVLFCRIGSCLMLVPGFASSRIPANVRLFLAFSITLALTPLLSSSLPGGLAKDSPAELLRLFASECLTGATIGFLARVFFGALETLSGVIAAAIGLASVLGSPMDEGESQPAISTLIILAATVLVFITNLHWEVLRGIAESYAAVPVTGLFDTPLNLFQASIYLTKSFLISLQISSPFVLYGLITNFALALANKLAPQIPFYFVTVPAVICGGLFLFYATCKPLLQLFAMAFSALITSG